MKTRPGIRANHYAVSSGHQLASEAAINVLAAGGNAVDAGVAGGIALGVLHPDLVNVAGVAPIIMRMADTGEVRTIDGLGTWPRAASVEFFERQFGGGIPEGILRTVVPAAPAAWITALDDFGTMSFGEVAGAAISYARDGFAVFPLLAETIAENEKKYAAHKSSADVFLPGGRPPRAGETFYQRDLAATLQYMVDEEKAAAGNRSDKLKAAYRAFYEGDIAGAICDYHSDNGGFMSRADMAGYKPRYEAPLRARFADSEFFTCGAWCQGISLAQAFKMLDANQLKALGHNSPAAIHQMTETYKLVFADRERYVADPAFVDVPVEAMLSPDYIAARRRLIDSHCATPEMPPPGDPRNGLALEGGTGGPALAAAPAGSTRLGDYDTSHVCVIDAAGNMFAATPSDTSSDTVIIPGTGLCPSSRGSQSRGRSSHINALAPGKRPRLTPNPALAVRDGKPLMTIGTPGGDVQIQAMTQVATNILCHGMDTQAAIEAPRFATYSFPSSFAPFEYFPGLLKLEDRIDRTVGEELTSLGHKVEWWPEWTWKAGGVCAVLCTEADDGGTRLSAGADPRRANTALGS
ncbi:MAG: gamma-glutamyltransferase [Alphaproteobacteria bacterium]|nr:gamma-glutamyltransferase [Alphaproteobacteria bacterium]